MFLINERKSLESCNSFFVFTSKSILLKNELLPDMNDFLSISASFKDSFYFAEPELKIASAFVENVPAGYKEMSIREYFSVHSVEEIFLISRSYSLYNWMSSFKYCPKCGSRITVHNSLSALFCPDCKSEFFPRIEPCIIVLVSKGDEVLLVRHSYRNKNSFVCIAGFIEAGECAEEAVKREVMEETGLVIKNVRYAGSQSWPFPDQLMLAFYADYESGTFNLQKEELLEAKWFKKGQEPKDLKPGSVAYRLVHGQF